MNSYGDESWLNYITKAMKPVDNKITQQALSLASYLEELLKAELLAQNILVEFVQIGGTSLNTNIATTDKVDLLMVFNGFLPKSDDHCTIDANVQELIILKELTKKILLKAFPEVQLVIHNHLL
ncbi:MAG: hypothetical protein JEZ09_02920 [Salinivirgaceae bacterium]|nr:hypothetical protein [Salinivirgaceae bacterium]